MKISYKTISSKVTKTEILVVFAKEGRKPNLPDAVSLPAAALKNFSGKSREVRFVDAMGGPAARVLLIGLGDGAVEAELMRRCGALAVKKSEKVGVSNTVFYMGVSFGKRAEKLGQALVEGIVMGAYRLNDFKSNAQKVALKKLVVQASADFNRGGKRGEVIGGGNTFARRLQDTPANKMRPVDLVTEAQKIAKSSKQISAKALDEKAMGKLGMGSLLSVSQGSAEPAYLIHLVYKPLKKAKRKICLVGKGITYDSGGICIKPSVPLGAMKYDMSGGAAVLGVFHALAGLDLDAEVHGLVPASENLINGSATKGGDVVTASNGLTIEVLNTDAEGRLILADALAYADKTIQPDAMIDLATLTGAVVVALGRELTGVMGNDEKLSAELIASGKESGEALWPLPILDAHKEDMKGAVADLKNISNPMTGAGSSTAGAFLSYFVGETPWAHLDIAGASRNAVDRDYQGGPMGTGVGVRLLVEYISRQ